MRKCKEGIMKSYHIWTEEERLIVRQNYQQSWQSCCALARRLGVTPYAIKGQAASLGILKATDRIRWTPEEKERLAELTQKYGSRRVAKMMHRSVSAVIVMSKKLSISRRYRDGWFTMTEVCEILGKDHKWVQRRINNGLIKATYHNGLKPSQIGGSTWHIAEKDLRRFIEFYPFELNNSNVDLPMIIDILVGIKYQKGA